MWSDVDLKTNTKIYTCVKEIGLRIQNMLTVVAQKSTRLGGPI